jgi:hypothetical protein
MVRTALRGAISSLYKLYMLRTCLFTVPVVHCEVYSRVVLNGVLAIDGCNACAVTTMSIATECSANDSTLWCCYCNMCYRLAPRDAALTAVLH